MPCDDVDISSGTSEDCNSNGIPDECEALPELRLELASGVLSDDFGGATDIDGDVIVVGAPRRESGGTDRGAAYVYRHNGTTWVFEQELTASDGTDSDALGRVVDHAPVPVVEHKDGALLLDDASQEPSIGRRAQREREHLRLPVHDGCTQAEASASSSGMVAAVVLP